MFAFIHKVSHIVPHDAAHGGISVVVISGLGTIQDVFTLFHAVLSSSLGSFDKLVDCGFVEDA